MTATKLNPTEVKAMPTMTLRELIDEQLAPGLYARPEPAPSASAWADVEIEPGVLLTVRTDDQAGPRDPMAHRNPDCPWHHEGDRRWHLSQYVRRYAIDQGDEPPLPPRYVNWRGGSGESFVMSFDGREFRASAGTRERALESLTRKFEAGYPELAAAARWARSLPSWAS
jgi:hypothetical protein